MPPAIHYRTALASDALCLSVLSTQVFLDTYATAGIRGELAREALQVHGLAAFEGLLGQPGVAFIVAESDGHLVAFAELASARACPVEGGGDVEIVRLYVHPRFQRRGIGAALCERAADVARRQGAASVWLTAWCGNARALAFYPAIGFRDIGRSVYVIEGTGYENRVFTRAVPSRAG